MFKKLTGGSLTSIGQYCDHGYTAIFTKHHANILCNNKIILQGHRNHNNNIWYFDLNKNQNNNIETPSPLSKTSHQTNYIMPKTNSAKLRKFLYGACRLPVVKSLVHSVEKDHLSTRPHLTPCNITQNIRAPTPTMIGHLDYQRKNKISTKRMPQSSLEMNLNIKPEPSKHKCNKANVSLHEHSDRKRMHTDQTSQFPIKSIRGHQHTLISCVYDTDTIFYRPLKTKQAE